MIAAAVYAGTLGHGFVVDDVHQIVENDLVTSVRHLPRIFATDVWAFEGRSSSYYRPLMYAFYMATWHVVGRAAWGYHLVNVLLHAVASLLVLLVARRLLEARAATPRAGWLGPGFVAGLLFAVHPVHTEAVAWVAAITDVGTTVFWLLALWLYLRAGDGAPLARPLAAVAYLLAMLCKETGAVLPLVLLAYEATIRGDRWHTRAVLRRLAPFGAAAAVYLVLRLAALGGLAPTAQSAPLGVVRYGMLVTSLLAGYLEMLVVPVRLNFWRVFAPPDSLASPAMLRALAVVASAGALGWIAARQSRTATLAIAMIVAPLLPAFHVAALNQGLGNALTERYVYLPSVGLVVLAALVITRLAGRGPRHRAVAGVVVAVVALAGAGAAVDRSRVWKDALSLWSDAAAKSPGSAIARLNHGTALYFAGRREEGEAELRRAVAMRPDLVDQEIARGAAYAAVGRWKQAILAFHMALTLDPRSAAARFSLGVTYDAMGNEDGAMREYEAAIALRPGFADAHNNLAVALAQRGRLDEALLHLQASVRARPADPETRLNLARVLDLKGLARDAEEQRRLAARAGLPPPAR